LKILQPTTTIVYISLHSPDNRTLKRIRYWVHVYTPIRQRR